MKWAELHLHGDLDYSSSYSPACGRGQEGDWEGEGNERQAQCVTVAMAMLEQSAVEYKINVTCLTVNHFLQRTSSCAVRPKPVGGKLITIYIYTYMQLAGRPWL